MTAFDRFNNLHNVRTSRFELISIIHQAKKENNASVIYRLEKILNDIADFNFEKLSNAPKITIRCINCEFESNTMEDFAFETSEGFYCTKSKCQKKATAPLSKR